MRTVAEIDADIAKAKAELQDVHGTQTEVYARIVGYYRSVRNWNKGKREEYRHRKLFVADEESVIAHLRDDCAPEPRTQDGEASAVAGSAASYELYVRKTCPNCPPVKDHCASLNVSGELVDVDQPEGLERAASRGVYSTPTAIFYDAEGNELARAYSTRELSSLDCLARAGELATAIA